MGKKRTSSSATGSIQAGIKQGTTRKAIDTASNTTNTEGGRGGDGVNNGRKATLLGCSLNNHARSLLAQAVAGGSASSIQAFSQQADRLLDDRLFIAQPLTSVYALSKSAFLEHEREHNRLLKTISTALAKGDVGSNDNEDGVFDLCELLTAEAGAVLLMPRATSLNHIPTITRRFVQAHIILAPGTDASTHAESLKSGNGSVRIATGTMTIGQQSHEQRQQNQEHHHHQQQQRTPQRGFPPRQYKQEEAALMQMLLAPDGDDTNAPDDVSPSAPMAIGHHVSTSTGMSASYGSSDVSSDTGPHPRSASVSSTGLPLLFGSSTIGSLATANVPSGSFDTHLTDRFDGQAEGHQSSSRQQYRPRAVTCSEMHVTTLAGLRGVLNDRRDQIRLQYDKKTSDYAGDKRYHTARLLREGRVPLSGGDSGLCLHVIVVDGPLPDPDNEWTPVTIGGAGGSAPRSLTGAEQATRRPAASERPVGDESLADRTTSTTTRQFNERVRAAQAACARRVAGRVVHACVKELQKKKLSPSTDACATLVGRHLSRIDAAVRGEMDGASSHFIKMLQTTLESNYFSLSAKQLFSDRDLFGQDKSTAQTMSSLRRWLEHRHLEIDAQFWDSELWSTATDELDAIQTASHPEAKLTCILNCCRVIIYQLQAGGSKASADDFLPHLIWTVIQCEEVNYHSQIEFIRRFCPAEALAMEALYFFTNLEIAVSFVDTVSPSSLSGISTDEFNEKMRAKI